VLQIVKMADEEKKQIVEDEEDDDEFEMEDD
jgi:hypothetical protein